MVSVGCRSRVSVLSVVSVVSVSAALVALGVPGASGASAASAASSSTAGGAQVRYVSTSGTDAGGCTSSATPCGTVQYAVDAASPGDTVSIAAGTYGQNVTIAGKSLTIVGVGAGSTVLTGHSYDDVTLVVRGTGANPSPDVTIAGLSLSDNVANPGLEVDSGDVVVDGSEMDDNVDYGAIVYAPGSLSLDDTLVDGNDGAGIAVSGGTLALHDATVSGNVAQASDENAARGGISVTSGTATVVDSTFGDNGGAGVYATAGASPASVTLADSTVDGNLGAGVFAAGASVALTADTVSGTRPLPAGGVPGLSASGGVVRADAAASVQVTASIVAQQSGAPDCSGAVVDGGYDLSGDTANSCGFTAGRHSTSRANARLGTLAYNGGTTWTRLPGRGSAALGRIPRGRAGCVPGATDQRGYARLATGATRCDIGAAEVG